jgi:hypothetical protein
MLRVSYGPDTIDQYRRAASVGEPRTCRCAQAERRDELTRTMTEPDQGGNRRGAIAGLAIAVVLLVVGLWLAHELTATSKMQDCLMSGRTNCNVIPAQ